MNDKELSVEDQMLAKDLSQFARQYDLEPIAAMLLPGLFRKASAETDVELLALSTRALGIKELGDYLADRARVLSETDAAKEIWAEYIQEGAA
jgi:hypothetical protein